MSRYTTEVRFICETAAGLEASQGYKSVESILDGSVQEVFDFDFPIFDEAYRIPLEKKILRHYYTREIGLETVGLWKLKLNTRLNEIMPYYNKLYESELLKFNPFYDVDLSKIRQGNRNEDEVGNDIRNRDEKHSVGGTEITAETGSQNVSTNDKEKGVISGDEKGKERREHVNNANKKDWDLFSDTPQGALTDVEDGTYLSSARKVTNNSNDVGTEDVKSGRTQNQVVNRENNGSTTGSTSKNITRTEDRDNSVKGNEIGSYDKKVKSMEDYVERVTGKNGTDSYSKRLMEFRQTFLNIDMLIINDLRDLFFYLWE